MLVDLYVQASNKICSRLFSEVIDPNDPASARKKKKRFANVSHPASL